MIPKTIHYCWFGGKEKPELARKCIASWKAHCPDFQIVEWNEKNFDVTADLFTKYCFENGKWAFLSDYARLAIVYRHGGFYFDTDVELKISLTPLTSEAAFFGFENNENVNTGEGFGAEAHHPILRDMMDEYAALHPDGEGRYPLIPCPALNTAPLVRRGLKLNGAHQIVDGARIFPAEFMNPYNDQTGKLTLTENTISIHWYSKSWIGKGAILRSKLTRPLHRLFGEDCFRWLKGKK